MNLVIGLRAFIYVVFMIHTPLVEGKKKVLMLLNINLMNELLCGKGGSCWLKVSEGSKCRELFTKNVNRTECCSAGPDLGYSEKDVSDAEIFFITAFKSFSATCSSCIGVFVCIILTFGLFKFLN